MKKQQGFTIIEVVLVLAIAGLIFLMVFIALPALQRNQRDTQRKSDVGRTVTAINNFQSNSKGNLPTTAQLTDIKNILTAGGDQYADPAYGDYVLTTSAPVANGSNMQYTPGSVCGDNGALTTAGGGNRKFAVRVKLENGQTYCASNN